MPNITANHAITYTNCNTLNVINFNPKSNSVAWDFEDVRTNPSGVWGHAPPKNFEI